MTLSDTNNRSNKPATFSDYAVSPSITITPHSTTATTQQHGIIPDPTIYITLQTNYNYNQNEILQPVDTMQPVLACTGEVERQQCQ